MPTASDAYLETQVMTASPERLHLMVVDAAIRFARQAERALEAAKYEAAYHALCRSRACVNDVLAGIHADPNPELADRLKGLLLFVHNNLVEADIRKDSQLVRDALLILETHRRTWLELLALLPRESSARDGLPPIEAATSVESLA